MSFRLSPRSRPRRRGNVDLHVDLNGPPSLLAPAVVDRLGKIKKGGPRGAAVTPEKRENTGRSFRVAPARAGGRTKRAGLVDEGLVAFSLGAQIVEQVAVEPQRDDVLAGRNDDVGLVPVDVEGRSVKSSVITRPSAMASAGSLGPDQPRLRKRGWLARSRELGIRRYEDSCLCV